MSLPWPAPWEKLFGRQAPLVVEIGFGGGEYLIDLATRHPDRNHVGIEVSYVSLCNLLRRVSRERISNVRALQGNAVAVLTTLFAPDSLTDVHLNFPDPWPKDRHATRRFVQDTTIALLADRLQEAGHFRTATDHAGLADWMAEVLERQGCLRSLHDSTSVPHIKGRFPTRYERKAREAGTPIRYFEWEKVRPPTIEFPVPEVHPMPNVTLRRRSDAGSAPDRVAARRLPSRTWQENDGPLPILVKLLATYDDPGGGLLLETLVKEGPLSQHFAVVLAPRTGGEVLLKLSTLGHPRPTWGVKRALLLLASHVLDTSPWLELHASTVGEVEPEEDPIC
jgi:tRNA (guanine-N7-)-methyltransferase